MTRTYPSQDKRRKGPEKQTTRLEIRLGPSLRERFLATCQRAGDTPSDVLRGAMSDYILRTEAAERKTLRQELIMKLIQNPLKTAGMTLAAALSAAVFIAPASVADTDAFNLLDDNKDGVLSTADTAFKEAIDPLITTADTNGDGVLSREEFAALDVVSGKLDDDTSISGIDLSASDGEKPKSFVMIKSSNSDLSDEEIDALLKDDEFTFESADGKTVKARKKVIIKKDVPSEEE